MAFPQYIFDGMTFNGPSDPYKLGVNLRAMDGWGVEITVRQRTNQAGVREQMSYQPRQIPFIVTRNDLYTGTPKTNDEFRLEMMAHFAPFSGERTLIAYHPDGTTQIFHTVDVSGYNILGQTAQVAELQGTFEAVDPIWRSVDTFTSTTNDGTFKALPKITVTPTTTCTHKIVQITDHTGRGLSGYPFKLPFALGANDWVFARGRSIPFHSAGWVLIDVPKNPLKPGVAQSMTLDVFVSTGIANPLYNELDLGGLSSGSSNTSWQIADLKISDHPNGSGAAKPIKIGTTYQSVSYGVVSEAAGSCVIGIDGTDKYDRQFDAAALGGGVEMTSISGSFSAATCADARIFIKGLPANGWWITKASAETTPQPFLTDDSEVTFVSLSLGGASLDDALAVCIGIEPTRSIEQMDKQTDESGNVTWQGLGYQRATGVLTIGSFTVALNASKVPTATVTHTGTGYYIDDLQIENATSGDILYLKRAFCTDDLIIDCYEKIIRYASGRGYADIRPSNPDDWLSFRPGANTVTATGLTVAYEYRNRYILL